MITCYLRYVIDPDKLPEFEKYSRMIMPLAATHGGTHHGTSCRTRARRRRQAGRGRAGGVGSPTRLDAS